MSANAPTTTDAHRDHLADLRRRTDALPAHRAERVDRERAQALSYVWGWQDAHGANDWHQAQGFSESRTEMVLDYLECRRTMLPSIADHFREWAGLR